MAANEPGQPSVSPTGWSSNLPTPKVALAIGAHPDDVEFGAGATLAKWAAAGCAIHHLVLTDGSKGTWNPDADIPALITARQAEQRAAARALGGGDVVFLGQVDGELDSGLGLRGEVARVIRLVKPDVVLGHDPWKRYRLHPDHRHAGLLACEGIVAARDPHFFREHGIPHHRLDTLLLWEADEPDHWEDVSTSVDTKLAALEQHTSQFESTMKAIDDTEMARFRDRIRSRLAGLGEPHGVAVDSARTAGLRTRRGMPISGSTGWPVRATG
jgi:LmbE family N-acetylglucosaminyl deacetylase